MRDLIPTATCKGLIELKDGMKAIVIGSGIGGLSAAIRLRVKGYEVQIFEKNSYSGGKLNAFTLGGYRFDTGPSLLTMPWWIDELFELAGENPRDHFNYKRKDTLCNYFWEDGKHFSASADRDTMADDASEEFNIPKETIDKYLRRSELKYDRTKAVFLEKSLHKWSSYLSMDTLKSIAAIPSLDLNESLHDHNEKSISEPHLVQLFDRYATYNGSSPFRTPGIMSLIPHLEMYHGAYIPRKGMHEISKRLSELAVRLGIAIEYEAEVSQILHDQKKVSGIRANGEEQPADVIISNMDVFSTYKHLLPEARKPKRILRSERSSSALIFYWGIKKEFPELDLHNILFTENYKEEFDHLFEKKKPYHDPTVYINITSKDVPEDAPSGCENWFVMINVPGDTSLNWDQMKTELRKAIVSKVNRILGISIEELIEEEHVWDPVGIEQDTYSYQGSLYGTSSNTKFAAFLRHPNFSKQFDNLFFCGGSAHPGGGIPLCLLSGKIASDLVPIPA